MPAVSCLWYSRIVSKQVYYNDIPVGTFCCRLETVDGKTRLYLMTMGVLAVRSLGITL